jgi:hypothetical protein
MAYFSVLSWHFSGKTENKKDKTFVRRVHIRTEYFSTNMDSQTQNHPNLRPGSLLVGRELQSSELDSSHSVLVVTGACVARSVSHTIMDSGQNVRETLS